MGNRNESVDRGQLSRYDLSYFAYRQLQRDYINFEEAYIEHFSSRFICRILYHYMCILPEDSAERFEARIREQYAVKPEKPFYSHRISLNNALTDKMREFSFVEDKQFGKRVVINYILEQFAALPLDEREKIYFFETCRTIRRAIEESQLLILSITTRPQTIIEVKPLDLLTDENTGSCYLIGYSRTRESDDAFDYCSIKLSRIRRCGMRMEEFSLSRKEETVVRRICEKFGAAYVPRKLNSDQIEQTVVRLTKYGYESLYLKYIPRQRPLPCIAPVLSDDGEHYELTFDCSHNQIMNYFFVYGKDAEVISPEWLRGKMKERYQGALEAYK